MTEADRLWLEVDKGFSDWGLTEIPFSESAVATRQAHVREVFTGRTEELRQALTLFRSRERKRLLVYGWWGIGKTAFILELLAVIGRHEKDTLTAYISLPLEATDLATFALVALARQMKEDEWAQHQLSQMGLRPKKAPVLKKGKEKAGIRGLGVELGVESEEESIPAAPPKFPTLSWEDLLERALRQYKRVIIAIDDLDKQDPARVRDMLHAAQGMLKGGASFILTGQPGGLTKDIVTSSMGLFDLTIELLPLDLPTTQRMLARYLSSARPKGYKEDPDSVRPFTPEAARALCERCAGVPRYFNRLGNYVLQRAMELQANTIDATVLDEGFKYAERCLLGQTGLTPYEIYVLELVLEKGALSDATVTLEELERLKVKEFNEVMPVLDKLVRLDLLRRFPSDRAVEFGPSPMLSRKPDKPE